MASNLRVIIDDKQTKIKIPSGTRMLVRRSCNAALQYAGFEGQAEVHVTFADNELFNTYADRRASTMEAPEVTALPSEEEGENLGTLIVSVERIMELTTVYNRPFEMGIVYASIHGVYNLLGRYYLDLPSKQALMVDEAIIMSRLGFAPLADSSLF